MITHLGQKELDKKKWNELIINSTSGDPFLLSDWLDVVFPEWSAIIAGEYKAGFPVFIKKRGAWSFLDLPNFVQKLSVLGDPSFEKKISDKLVSLQQHVSYTCLTASEALVKPMQATITPRRHQLLHLTEGVRFPTKVWGRNIRKAEASGLTSLVTVPSDILVESVQAELKEKGNPYSASDYTLLKKLARVSVQKGFGFIEGIQNATGEYVCGQFYLYIRGKIYLAACFSKEEARQHSLLHYVLYKIIQRYYEQDKALRVHFGGSNIPVIADFNKNFGAEDEEFVLAYSNRLPFWLRIFKHA